MVLDWAAQKVSRGGLAPWQLRLALHQLLRYPCNDLSMAELALLCGLSRSHFVKAFKVSMGEPPHRWLISQRVRRAREMLEKTDESISLIALNCGFSDQSHLTRLFHAQTGYSPAVWRRQSRAGIAPATASATIRAAELSFRLQAVTPQAEDPQ